MRVLRPAAVARPSSPSGQEEETKADPMALDAADANAIEEVNLAYENVKEVDVLDVSKEGTDSWEAATKRYTFATNISVIRRRIYFMWIIFFFFFS